MANIFNTASNTLLSGTDGNDSIQNGGWNNGDWKNNGGYYSGGNNVTINAGAGNDTIYNIGGFVGGSKVTIDAGTGNDYIYNEYGNNVTISAGAGNDLINNWNGENISVEGGAGDDTLEVHSDGGKTLTGGTGSDLFIFYYDSDYAYGTDTITDYEEADTIQFNDIAVSKISTNSSGHVIFKAGKNKLVVKNAADKVITYIDADGTTKTFGGSSADEWQLDGTTATYSSLTVTALKVWTGSA